MTNYRFMEEVAQRFHADAVEARSKTQGLLGVDTLRRIADRTAAAFVKSLKEEGRIVEIVADHPGLLDRRSAGVGVGTTAGETILELVEEDIVRVLDVRLEWADQFGEEYVPAQAMADEAEIAISAFDRVSRLGTSGDGLPFSGGYDDLERDEVCKSARAAVENYRADVCWETRDQLYAAMAPIVGSLRDLRWQAELDRFMASVEAFNRLGRAPDGSWELAW
jgi:hypothetical protein